MKNVNQALIASLLLTALATSTPAASAAQAQPKQAAVQQKLAEWQQQGTTEYSASRGAALWQQDFDGRSCRSCHGSDLKLEGKHQRTGKAIAPMAPSVNPKRLTDTAFIDKWLLRNCKWTLGRECSPQEKGDLISWLSQQ
ncbi:DUF1924 domain-containing protein [Oceanobacter mangrovi]|uniref:DUF1924 domain-containing protein n=1 Tax=Oceanobacter mangrovi TaxID=2862510 RepID=UPI001C8D949B|nr:DUF1924 domain-containing protein [Oceanobacter mangrovi]